MTLLWTSLVLFLLGVLAWAGGYLKWTRHLPEYHPFRGLPCVPGLVLVVISLVLFAFFWHWVVGSLVIVGTGYAGVRLIMTKR